MAATCLLVRAAEMDRREPVMRGGPMGGGGRHSLPPCAYISNEIHRSLHYGCRNEFIWRSALSEEKKKKKNDWRNALMAVRKLSYTLVLESTPIDCRTRSGKQIVVILRLKKKGRQVIPDNIFFSAQNCRSRLEVNWRSITTRGWGVGVRLLIICLLPLRRRRRWAAATTTNCAISAAPPISPLRLCRRRCTTTAPRRRHTTWATTLWSPARLPLRGRLLQTWQI